MRNLIRPLVLCGLVVFGQSCLLRGFGQVEDAYGNIWMPTDGNLGIALNRQETVAFCGVGRCKRIGRAVYCAIQPDYKIRRKKGTAACGLRRSEVMPLLCEPGRTDRCTQLFSPSLDGTSLWELPPE